MLIYILAGLRPVLFLGCFVEQDQKAVQHTDVLQCVLIRLCVIVALVLYSAEIFWGYIHETCIAGKLFYGSDVRIKDRSSSSARVVPFFLHAAGFYDLFTDGFCLISCSVWAKLYFLNTFEIMNSFGRVYWLLFLFKSQINRICF